MRLFLHGLTGSYHRKPHLLIITIAILLVTFSFSTRADVSRIIQYTSNPSYDSIPITPITWEEIDLVYYSTIHGQQYQNNISLLRPIAWLRKRHMDSIASHILLSIPVFGIVNVNAVVTAIKPTHIDTRNVDWSAQKSAPIIGRFRRYVSDVRTYTFRDNKGHIFHINATPNHPFYVKNMRGFVAIRNIVDTDELLGINPRGNQTLHLLCNHNKHTHCGKPDSTGRQPMLVYNFEVYKRHTYRVGDDAVLVHNVCGMGAFNDDGINHFTDQIASLRTVYPEGGCGYFAVNCVLQDPSKLASLPMDGSSSSLEDVYSLLNIKQDEAQPVVLFDLFGINPPSYTDHFVVQIRDKITHSIKPGEARLLSFHNLENAHVGILARKGDSIVFIDQHLDDVPGDYYTGGWNGFQKTLKDYFSKGVYFKISKPLDSRNIIHYIK